MKVIHIVENGNIVKNRKLVCSQKCIRFVIIRSSLLTLLDFHASVIAALMTSEVRPEHEMLPAALEPALEDHRLSGDDFASAVER